MAAFQDVQKNPANISKYENNPKIQSVLSKLSAKVQGSAGVNIGGGGGHGPKF